nr:MAG TPA: TRYPTOPHAN ZIPPER 2-hairpin, type I' turn [Bacteriophage sp.]
MEGFFPCLNSEMSYFKAYKFTDSDVLDNDIKTAIGWYINNAIDKKRHSFIITLELTKGSTFSIFGMTASTPSYCAAQVFSYALPVPLYGIRNNGTWTWK